MKYEKEKINSKLEVIFTRAYVYPFAFKAKK